MDAARTIVRKSNAKVDVIFFRGREEVTALDEEVNLALVDGVKFNYYLNTIKIEEDGIIVEPVLKIENEDGTIEYKNDSEHPYKIPSSSVIIAIGQGAQTNIVKNTKAIDTNQKGLIQTDEKGATTRPGVYAAGDVVSGAKTVVAAVEATKKAADEIDNYIRSKYGLPSLEEERAAQQ